MEGEYHMFGPASVGILNHNGSEEWDNDTHVVMQSKMSLTGDYIYASVLLFICKFNESVSYSS